MGVVYHTMGCANSSSAKAVEAPVNLLTSSQPVAQKVETQVQQMPADGDDCSTVMATEASAPPSSDATNEEEEVKIEMEQEAVVEMNEAEAEDLEMEIPKV